MEKLSQLVELTDKFVALVGGERVPGRRFDRVLVGGQTKYFIEKGLQVIYGAKSSFQFNPRRQYCSLTQMDQFDWQAGTPKPGTAVETDWAARESIIKSGYKKRGRPRKNPVLAQPTFVPKADPKPAKAGKKAPLPPVVTRAADYDKLSS